MTGLHTPEGRAGSLHTHRAALIAGATTSLALVTEALFIAEACQKACNAFATIATDHALAAARQSNGRDHRPGKLEGLPIAIKDNIDTYAIPTSYGSRAYADHRPQADAPIVARLRAEGAIVIGKAATHEFAWGVTTESAAFGPTRNPHDRTKIPGGSSGGLAVAVAYGAVAAGIGSDTGGSVRIPAALCGVTGFKPSAGLWSTEGFFPLSPTLDHPGIIGARVDDVAMLAAALGLDAGSANETPSIEILDALPDVPVSAEVARHFERAVGILSQLLPVRRSKLGPVLADMFSVFAGTVLAEAGMVHFARSSPETIATLYDPDTRSRLERARQITLADYEDCQARRRGFAADFAAAMEADFLILPTCPCTAPAIGADDVTIGGWSGTVREALMTYTSPFNLNGYPAISVPLPVPPDTLPIGLQIVGRPGDDARLLRLARTVETALERQ